MCKNCDTTKFTTCQSPTLGRVPIEATGIDVMETCKRKGVSISNFPLDKLNGVLTRVGLFLIE